MDTKKRIALISTGGTIEKTYDALTGVLANRVAVLDVMLAQMDLRGVGVSRIALMNKDSLDMTPEDHALIAATVGPFHEFGPTFGPGRPSPTNLQIAEDMGRYVNSFRWRGDPPG